MDKKQLLQSFQEIKNEIEKKNADLFDTYSELNKINLLLNKSFV